MLHRLFPYGLDGSNTRNGEKRLKSFAHKKGIDTSKPDWIEKAIIKAASEHPLLRGAGRGRPKSNHLFVKYMQARFIELVDGHKALFESAQNRPISDRYIARKLAILEQLVNGTPYVLTHREGEPYEARVQKIRNKIIAARKAARGTRIDD